MLPQFINMLSGWQWGLLALVPPAIIALYFLKLKRIPLEVPSTYLWRKSIEDMHVNSIWQRLRKNLLLLLQLLLLLLAILALVRPGWRGQTLSGDRFIFAVDHSASMSATDVEPSRLEEAKRRVLELIDQMGSGSKAMVIRFSDEAQVVQEFTNNRRLLRERLMAIQPSERATSLDGALQLAAGLANPPRTSTDAGDVQVAEPMPATVYIFSDGKFPQVKDFSLGNLTPVFVPIGQPGVENVAITRLSVRPKETRPNEWEAFAQFENFTEKEIRVSTELYLSGELVDADELDVSPDGPLPVHFDLGEVASGDLRLTIDTDDALQLDNQAYAAIGTPRRARVLLVTPGSEPLALGLTTDRASTLAEITIAAPDVLESEDYDRDTSSGQYDLVIYDQCAPKALPPADTLFIGVLPPAAQWQSEEAPADRVVVPIDINHAHPLMQFVDMNDVLIDQSLLLNPPAGSSTLIDSNLGTIFAVAPRGGFEDAVLGFAIIRPTEEGMISNTNWYLRPGFPTFLLNTLEYLGGHRSNDPFGSVRPGKPVRIQSSTSAEQLTVVTPDGTKQDVPRSPQGWFQFQDTNRCGLYELNESGKVTGRLAVNLFDRAESDIRPQPDASIPIGNVDVAAVGSWEPARRELWKFLLAAALGVLLVEWYIYNRRVYI